MRFNPPPNWPQPPAGWTPPPGWEPDPSWPQPPFGWPLWVDEDEFVIAPYGAATSWTRSTEPWYRRTVFIVLLLIFCFPVGLVLLWLRPDWSVRRRGVITAVVGIVVIIALATPSPAPTTTTVLSPTAAGGAPVSSTAPASSQPAAAPSSTAPSPVVTKSRTPVPSAPPKTTAASPAYVPPAPVHTTQAPQAPRPVQTTTQAQENCHPLTDGGKCYEPGEYCRKDDRGKSGVDGKGDPIVCEDNDGWRWERG
jgi:hypothetical protein